MTVRAQLSELNERARSNPATRLIASLIIAIGAFLQYWSTGFTLVFVILAVLAVIPIMWVAFVFIRERWEEHKAEWLRTEMPVYDYRSKVSTLTGLISEFQEIENAKALAEATTHDNKIRVLAIMPVEGSVGVLLSVGQKEHVKIGTPLLVYRTDQYTQDGQCIEKPIGLVKVTYVQSENNCSQAKVLQRLDAEFWDQKMIQLQKDSKVAPPSNFAQPFVPDGLHSLSTENMATLRTYLASILNLLTGKTPE